MTRRLGALALAIGCAVGCSGELSGGIDPPPNTDDVGAPTFETGRPGDPPDTSPDGSTADAPGPSVDAPVDAPTPDAMVDAPADGAPTGCTAKLCEDFEAAEPGGLPDPKIWSKAAGSGTIQVTTAKAHRGTKSLFVRAPSGSYETYLKTSAPFPAKDKKHWGRLWFFYAEDMTTNFVHWNLVEARGKGSNNRIRVGGINNPHGGAFFWNNLLFNVETAGSGEKAIDDDGAQLSVKPQAWHCLEWMYDHTPGANEAKVFYDGAERPKLNAKHAWFETRFVMPDLDALYIGWGVYQTYPKPYEVWIDDVAAGDTRIGCD